MRYILYGIYGIKNKVNKKIYIGQSNNIDVRYSSHLLYLRKNKHNNAHLQRAWNKYGEENFELIILENFGDNYRNKSNLNEREKYWIEYYKSYDNKYGYNILRDCFCTDKKVSEETKKKLRISLNKKETKEKIKQTINDNLKKINSKFPNVQKEIFKYNLKINDKDFELVYRIKKYKKIKDQSKENLIKLRESGLKLKKYGLNKNNNIYVIYYELIEDRYLSLETKQKIINAIFNIQFIEKLTLKDEIEEIWLNKNYHKTQKDTIKDRESIILDILASYYLQNDNKIDDIITEEKEKQIEKFEKSNFSSLEKYNYKLSKKNKKWEIRKNDNPEDILKYTNKKRQLKKWYKSKTYKLSNIYSYIYDKDIIYWDWIKGDWDNHKSNLNVNVNRLIDPSKPKIDKWCIVDSDNVFEFNNKKFSIDNKILGYQVKNKAVYVNGKLNDFTNESNMNKILCFYIPHEDKYYFFDENINRISNKFINSL